MPSMYTVLRDTKAALRARLVATSPNRDTAESFREMSDVAQSQRDIKEATGRIRLFQIARADYQKVDWISSSVRANRVHLPLGINYPNTPEWRDAAFDDFEALGESLRDTPLSVSGLALCVVDMETGPVFEDTADDDWFTMTVNVIAICEAS